MNETNKAIELSESWKPRALIIGGVLGTLVGVSAAYLLIKSSEEQGPPKISRGEGVKLGLLVLGLLRIIATLSE